jgi:hypothetical protein
VRGGAVVHDSYPLCGDDLEEIDQNDDSDQDNDELDNHTADNDIIG